MNVHCICACNANDMCLHSWGHGVASLVLLFQSALRSQSLAAGRNEADPVFEVLGKLWALDLNTQTQKLEECCKTQS